MTLNHHLFDRLRSAMNVDRLVNTAVRLIDVPSPTCSAGKAADCLAEMLTSDGFTVDRPVADWPQSPAVVTRLKTNRPGRTLQFNGHLDTVHLPFVPPTVEQGMICGSGASDMKGGIAAACEALHICRDADALPAGQILFTTQDLHESPWGDQRQIKAMIREGYVGDAVLLPEYLSDRLPVMGRGMAVFEVTVSRDGLPMHEVVGGLEQPNVIAAGGELIHRFMQLDQKLARKKHPLGDRESLFIGQVGAGQIYNQSPTEFKLSGTRRWLPGTDASSIENELKDVLGIVSCRDGIDVTYNFQLLSGVFELDENATLSGAFQEAYAAVVGQPLPVGTKPFLDDGNQFFNYAKIPAITHGPNAQGAHTIDEKVPICELERVALVYALTAVQFCGSNNE